MACDKVRPLAALWGVIASSDACDDLPQGSVIAPLRELAPLTSAQAREHGSAGPKASRRTMSVDGLVLNQKWQDEKQSATKPITNRLQSAGCDCRRPHEAEPGSSMVSPTRSSAVSDA
jgi:hypothetical protein